MIKFYCAILLFISCIKLIECKDKNGTLRIEIVRQKTPREQIWNAPDLNGIDFEWAKPKPNNRTNDSIALYRFLDHEFYGKVVIGHPGQTLNVALDTSWGLTWVLSSRCASWKNIGCWFHNKYDHSKSSEWRKDGRPYVANEGEYNMTGFFQYDNFSIAHVNASNQSFVEMVNVGRTFLFNKADGVLGLGLKVDQYDPFFYTLLKEKRIKDPIFSIYLNRDRQSIRGGNVMLGFIDDKHIHKNRINNQTIMENITYLNVDPGVFWQFNMDKVYIGHWEKSLVPYILCQNSCKAFVDSSSNTIIGPEADVNKIHDTIQARDLFFGRYSVNCDTVNKLPKIDFNLAGKNFTLTGPQYTIKIAYKSITVCISAFVSNNIPSVEEKWVLGGAFLSEYYSIYRVNDKQIGFVKAA